MLSLRIRPACGAGAQVPGAQQQAGGRCARGGEDRVPVTVLDDRAGVDDHEVVGRLSEQSKVVTDPQHRCSAHLAEPGDLRGHQAGADGIHRGGDPVADQYVGLGGGANSLSARFLARGV
ncbi:hypothetical protein ABZ252_15555 [Streptomyces sp. NPDC006175]|uniref:hypothetical protein n=1 Tax=Streptomyces sp. NPDC006175 TaxID=3154471 RepID=UPI0033B72C99